MSTALVASPIQSAAYLRSFTCPNTLRGKRYWRSRPNARISPTSTNAGQSACIASVKPATASSAYRRRYVCRCRTSPKSPSSVHAMSGTSSALKCANASEIGSTTNPSAAAAPAAGRQIARPIP